MKTFSVSRAIFANNAASRRAGYCSENSSICSREYCFSHYVAAAVLFLTRFRLLYPDWHGYVISFFGRVWASNFYMAGFANLRLDIHHERVEIKSKDLDVQSKSEQLKMDGVA
jgi:hypothetical protein